MAVTASGLFGATLVDAFDTTQLAVDLDLETHRYALFSNSITPNFTTDTAYGVAPYNANEVTGTGWSAGGVLLVGTTFTASGGVATFDATDISESSTTLTDARCGVIYADALAGDNAIFLQDFAADFSTTAGTFQVIFNASGIFTVDYTP